MSVPLCNLALEALAPADHVYGHLDATNLAKTLALHSSGSTSVHLTWQKQRILAARWHPACRRE